MSFNQILDKHRKLSFSQADKGDRFERLMQGFLLTDPTYTPLIKTVWLWSEFPARSELGGQDTGIDLVALTFDGEYWAVQCKCYQADSTIDKRSLDSFLATSSREFKNEQGERTRFACRLWISTTNNWGANAAEAIINQNPPFNRINLHNLQDASVDWEKLDAGIFGEPSRVAKKQLRPHQLTALNEANKHFNTSNRGKLIMACGTGKTFTSLRIAENETDGKGLILFLVPSISLLGQTLREWCADAHDPINAICICSDSEVSRKKHKNPDIDAFSVIDLALPASTSVENIISQFRHIKSKGRKGLTVVFSTYQSIEVISRTQKRMTASQEMDGIFDLIICDEAHRTTGVTLSGDDESAFIKVHDDSFIKAKKRLYMTATPRLYSDDSKSKAAMNEAILCSMDDVGIYGEEIYRIGFGEAVEKDLLADYKVLILTLSDKDVPPSIQRMIANKDNQEINADDASKLIGCINALSKQILGDEGIIKDSDPDPMKRAVAFCQSIASSKNITDSFNETSTLYINELPPEKQEKMVHVGSKHIDGTMSAPQRDELMGWLKEDSQECRVLTNVRCLSEGVDVPSLDAVLFLSARNSQVDVVQSVGRVMRRSPNKKYGYIIIPVLVSNEVEANKALDNNERYRVVWTVLNALRAHDDRFNATVNKIELNHKKPDNILVGRPDYTFDENGDAVPVNPSEEHKQKEVTKQMRLEFEELQSVVYAKMVQKVGDRLYWEQWAKSVAEIAERQIERIQHIVENEGEHKHAFSLFLKGLQQNINPSITQQQAIEMLGQHIITKPVFEALFEGYSFVKNNPISISMQTILDKLEAQVVEKDTETLDKFYDSVRKRAEGIDNAEGKQHIIIELYNKFFKTAFPKMVEQLGIVYTPVEVVDFIVHSVNDVLKQEFGRSISDENVHILDPFTGTGTFITRLLQSGLIDKKDLQRKYTHELHANEIVLLAYYIAAVNIENAYHDIMGSDSEYKSFDGICLTDTFQLGETDGTDALMSEIFPQNSERVVAQKKAPIRVIMGNPPYSIGQKSANDNAQNQSYPKLGSRIAETYAKESKAGLNKSLYDAYIKAFRWSTDRLDKDGGIICFVSNGAWLDGNSADGFRKCLETEFSSIWVFNLRGNARTSGALRQKEAGNVFGGGSRTPISITLLVKNPHKTNTKATIHYHDIGDYLSREEKLEIIKKTRSVNNSGLSWKVLEPNNEGDWISLRNSSFEMFIPIESEKKFDAKTSSFFVVNSRGNETGRDVWVYNSLKNTLKKNMENMVSFFNQQVADYKETKLKSSKLDTKDFVNTDSKIISWTSSLISNLERGNIVKFEPNSILTGVYRPFFKQNLYSGDKMIHRRGQMKEFFPTVTTKNFVICVSGIGGSKDFSVILTSCIPDVQLQFNGQCFPLYYYEEQPSQILTLFDKPSESGYIRRDGVSDFIFERAHKTYGTQISKEDIFYYVYGILHSPDYRETFANDLKKMLPRLPLVEDVRDFWAFSKAGRKLADLHLNYESVAPYPEVVVDDDESGNYWVEKMRYPKKGQKDTIFYNSHITISHIPDKAYEYIVNGKSAIDWIMERYQITTDKDSGIKNDPNDWAKEVEKPRYILDLLLSVIHLSVQTVDIVKALPPINFDKVS